MRLRAPLLAPLAAALALVAAPPAAHADRLLLEPVDAQDLADQLAEAREATGVCFGWELRLDAFDGSPSGVDSGSDRGVDVPSSGCERQLAVLVEMTYTSEASEADDSASVSVAGTGFPGARADDLLDLAGVDTGDLLGDDDDKALFNLAAALPLLAGQLDPSVAARLPELERGGAPADAALQDDPGSDWLRAHGPVLGIGVLLAAIAAWLIGGALLRRRTGADRPPTRPRPRST